MDQERWHVDQVCSPRSFSGRNYDRFVSYNTPETRSKAPIWTQLWKKIKKEKKRMFQCSNTVRFTYDTCSYEQNFDQGLMFADADDLSRSFSARFAVPSRMFEKNRLIV
ncbi:hypothetical protein BUALT_Bualt02G0114400 [Buddleja alternifolia]|uniref:Uncharacterized protein n=1 Tax=Buddleja alternifolia TaxID=168488 RepID=A0AAV6Y0Q6_9LAMI|nr:hypothetical protein BUALT_Bualt02G0114400 [Buddleja alternifolia]